MDIVYLVKKGVLNNIELLFSLRSLKYIKHDRVFIVGYKPFWIKNVIHIPFNDTEHKYNNVRNKQQLIANTDEISEDFIYMNDDFYFLKEQEVKYYKIGTNKEHLKYIKERDSFKRINHGYYNNLVYIKETIGDKAIDFETHTPIIFNRNKLKELFENFPDHRSTSLRSLYCNYFKIKGKYLPDTPNYKNYKQKLIDCKCYTPNTLIVNPKQLLLSSENKLARTNEYYNFMNILFPEESNYEEGYIRDMEKLKYKHKNHKKYICLPKK